MTADLITRLDDSGPAMRPIESICAAPGCGRTNGLAGWVLYRVDESDLLWCYDHAVAASLDAAQ